ncbi:unnamed protein product, partial [Ectocarpus fasciculatus]
LLFLLYQATVGLRVPADQEIQGMDLTRHNSISASFNAGGQGGSGGRSGSLDAVHRALAQANGDGDDPYSYSTRGGGGGGGGGGHVSVRSHHSSRAASLTSSRNGDFVAPSGGGGGSVAVVGKHEPAWGWGHNTAAAAASADQQLHASRSKASLFGGGDPSKQPGSAAEAVTPSMGREGSGYRFHVMGGGGGGGRPGQHEVVGVPVRERPLTPDLGKPRPRHSGRQQQQQVQAGAGASRRKVDDP